jgi:hypothetical protein
VLHEKKTVDWKEIHENLRRLAREKGKYDYEEGRWLLRGLRHGVHVPLGYGTYAEYVERLFGYKPRFVAERLRVAEALEELPEIGAALAGGQLSWSAVRELSGVATPETAGAWLAAARDKTARQVEDLVAGRRPGDRPSDPANERARRHVLRFEVSAETVAEFREAQAKVQRDAGRSLDSDDALRMIARQILGGPTDEGRASYQIAMTVCEQCGRGYQQGAGELLEVGSEIVEMAACDAQTIGSTHVGRPARATQTIPPAIRRQIVRRDHGRCAVPSCRSSRFLDIHHVRPRAEGGTHDPAMMTLLCGAHHRAVHRGFLIIEGTAPNGLRFLHADGTCYGAQALSPERAEHAAEAVSALRQHGITETQARSGLDAALAHVGPDASLEPLLRKALAETRQHESMHGVAVPVA